MRLLRVLAALAVVVAGATLDPDRSGAAGDFYTPPAQLGVGSAGQIISAEPFRAMALLVVPLPAKAWRVMYRSTSAAGQPVAVTGTVLVPTTRWTGAGARPLVGVAAGTQGLADRCAVSRQLAKGTEYEAAVIAQALLRGWAVAVTDYQGLGTPGEHPYVVGQALGRNVLDAMRAARTLPGAGLSSASPMAIYGFSEGGGAAAWALQLQPTYAPELTIAAGAVGGTASDFTLLMDHFDNGSPFAFLILYAAIGFDAAYPELQLARYLTAAGVAAVSQLRQTCIQDAITHGLLMPKDVAHYAQPSPLHSPAWQARLHQNDLGYTAPKAPVLIGGSRADEIFPYQQESLLYERWCARGVNARLIALPVPEHLVNGAAFAVPGLQFIADRLAGKPLARASNCSPSDAG